MTTQLERRPRRSDAAIDSLLARLRRRIRAYVWIDGLAVALIVAGASFWLSLALDWTFEPPKPLRMVYLVLVGLALGWVVVRLILERLLVRLSDKNLALLVERRFGQFQDSLLTAVELGDEVDTDFNPAMFDRTRREATARLAEVDLARIFKVGPLARRIALALGLAAGTAVFAVACPDALAVWARRSLAMSDELWPRSTRLVIEGFDAEQHTRIARGSDWTLVVKADAATGRIVPEIVEVRYTTADGSRGRDNMSREGLVAPGAAAFQPFVHTFKSVLAPLDFYVRGGDDRRGPYHLDVVDSPTLGRMTLRCRYPSYMDRENRDVNGAGLVQIPRGTEISLVAEANKPLVAVDVDDVTDENAPQSSHIDLLAENGQPKTQFHLELARLDADKTLLFNLHDADGIRSRDAVRLALSAVPDEPPQVNVQLKGIGAAITPGARLPAAGEVADDYGVAKVWFEFHVDETPPRQQPFGAAADGREKLAVADALEVQPLELQPKQKLHVAVSAADASTLEGGPNVGMSQRYTLDVVTPEQLRAMLEARELQLRRRFETIIEEFTETRDLLARVVVQPKAAGKPAGKTTDGASDDKDPVPPPEPGDEPEPATRTAVPAVQIERVAQNAQRSAHESLEVALAFDEIREELVNNRIDIEELKTRLKDGVADPLKRIVAESFPRWEAKLKQLAGQLGDPALAGGAQKAAVAEADAILVEMKQVLDKMMELETFNEVVDMLRQIISAQEKVSDQTKTKQKKKLRDLVE